MGEVRVWSINMVQEALTACHDLWWRSPGAGRWPFAGDGPWNLIRPEQGDVLGEASTTLLDTGRQVIDVIKVDTARRPRTPLDAAEVAERDRVTAWLAMLGEVEDKRIVHVATHALWQGDVVTMAHGPTPSWSDIRRRLGLKRTPRSVAWRYRRALAAIVCGLNGWPESRAKVLAAGSVDAAA